ncbi:MAG: hypothetical protein ABIR73_05650 [Usitatibacter sp.]
MHPRRIATTLVFAPLGPAYLPHAVLACLIVAIVGGLIAAARSGSSGTARAWKSPRGCGLRTSCCARSFGKLRWLTP